MGATDCITIGGPGATKPCLATFSYDHARTVYRGCINQETPGQYISVVPDFGNNAPAPKDESSSNSISFLASVSPLPVAPRRVSSRHHSSGEVRSLFCVPPLLTATATSVSGASVLQAARLTLQAPISLQHQ